MLSALVTGRCEAAENTPEQWVAAVVKAVPYHPAGRFPEKKVHRLGLAGLPAALPGERALVEKLAALPTTAERWALLYDTDEAGLQARLDEPADLGASYDPAMVLGPKATWNALIDWGKGQTSAFPEVLAGRGWTWVLVGDDGEAPAVLGALEERVPGLLRVDGAKIEAELEARVDDPAERFVLVGAGEGIRAVLSALSASQGLRDRVLAVLAVGGAIGGPERQDWMEANFTHRRLDTELARTTSYLAVQWLDRTEDPPGAYGLPLGHARFPEAKLEADTDPFLEVVDLGPLPADSDPELVAQGLWVFLTCWVESRRQ